MSPIASVRPWFARVVAPGPMAAAALLSLLWLFTGVVGHDPWKQDDGYVFGIVWSMAEDGDLVVPKVAGDPFMEKPPLYYWVALATMKVFGALGVAPHDAARLATPLLMAAALLWTALAARRWLGSGTAAAIACVTVLGTVGLIDIGHLMVTDVALFAAFALAAWAFALVHDGRASGPWWLGAAIGAGFLSKGLIAPIAMGMTGVLLALAGGGWSSLRRSSTLVRATAAALPWLLGWPLALWHASPDRFVDWFWWNNVGRLLGFSTYELGAGTKPGFWLRTLPWFLFPALPALALVALRAAAERVGRPIRAWAVTPCTQWVLASVAPFAAIVAVSASARAMYVLPAAVPLAIAVAQGADRVPRLWDRVLSALAGAVVVLALALWGVWALRLITGDLPAAIVEAVPLPLMDVAPRWTQAVGAVALLAAIVALFRAAPLPRARGLWHWALAFTFLWGSISTLWMPWLDVGRSYRGVVEAVDAHRARDTCVASIGLGEVERAVFHYVGDLVTVRLEQQPTIRCDQLLLQGFSNAPPTGWDPEGWVLRWTGGRVGDDRERFWLFDRARVSDLSLVDD